jgi:hypothetical protein
MIKKQINFNNTHFIFNFNKNENDIDKLIGEIKIEKNKPFHSVYLTLSPAAFIKFNKKILNCGLKVKNIFNTKSAFQIQF